MDDEGWRLSINCSDRKTAQAMRSALETSGVIATGVTGEGSTLFVYGPTKEAVEAHAAAIRNIARELESAVPILTTDQWLQEDRRWSSERGPRRDDSEEDQQASSGGWLDAILDGLRGGP